jgi:hypothetical protein
MERLSILLDKIFGRFFEVKEPPKYLSGKREKTDEEKEKAAPRMEAGGRLGSVLSPPPSSLLRGVGSEERKGRQ